MTFDDYCKIVYSLSRILPNNFGYYLLCHAIWFYDIERLKEELKKFFGPSDEEIPAIEGILNQKLY